MMRKLMVLTPILLLAGCATTAGLSKCDKARLAVEAAQQAVGYFCPITLPQ